MRALANNPYCVWFDCKVRTFKTLEAAERFAKGRNGRIGLWCEASGWWVERGIEIGLPDDDDEPEPRTYCEFCPGVDGAGCCVCGNDLPTLTPAV